ncbi:hypothetical protein D3C87_2079420 [compost metagenome]
MQIVVRYIPNGISADKVLCINGQIERFQRTVAIPSIEYLSLIQDDRFALPILLNSKSKNR